MMLMLMRWLCQRCGRWCAQDRCGGRRGPGRAAGHRSGTPRYWRAPLPREQCGRRHTRQVRVQVRPKAQRGRGVGASFRLPLHLLGLRRRLLHPPCPIPSAFLPLPSASPNVCPPILFPPPSSSTLHQRPGRFQVALWCGGREDVGQGMSRVQDDEAGCALIFPRILAMGARRQSRAAEHACPCTDWWWLTR